MRTVAIPNICVKLLTPKNDFPQDNCLHYLMQTEMTRQIPFGLTEIQYDIIKYEMVSIQIVQYTTDIGRNDITEDYIDNFSSVYLH